MDEIESINEASSTPLVSQLYPISHLNTIFPPSSPFRPQISTLSSTFTSLRIIKGDGSCFYRAFLYSILTSLLTSPPSVLHRLTTYIKTSLSLLGDAGYSKDALEMFHDEFVELLEVTVKDCREKGGEEGMDGIHKVMTEEGGAAEYCCWYMRPLCSLQLKSDPKYSSFLPSSYSDISDFCKREVEPTGRECDQLRVIALAEAFEARVEVSYVDGHDKEGKVTKHTFGEGTDGLMVNVMYRPGHYDLLYP